MAALAIAVGLWLLHDRAAGVDPLERLAGFDPFGRGRPVTLTGLGRSGQVEVPVINLWEQPGFDRDNHVAARIPMDADGQVEARLVDTVQAAGLTWDEIRLRDARGWVVSRFVAE